MTRIRIKSCALALAGVLLAMTGISSAAPPPGACPSPNRLIDSGSPYLLQHACNPVDWYPWGEEAFAKARREGKPMFVSVGYSTCYWCHVANRTLYSNPEIARLMNQWFVNVKVDREQRPDVDQTYMLATQLLTGRGGWPNNVFLTPEGKPFFAGSYFPPQDDDQGRPGFPTVLQAVREALMRDPDRVRDHAEKVAAAMRQAGRRAEGSVNLQPGRWMEQALSRLGAEFDPVHGGFSGRGDGARFPRHPVLRLLVEHYRVTRDPQTLGMLTRTLDAMALGGIHDHLGGGFHRYAVDSSWSMPHFEKMLYDNAQLLRVYAEAYELTGSGRYRDAARGIARYLRRRMEAPEGGFYTAEDAEVNGHESASYAWTRAQVEAVLGPRLAARLFRTYQLTALVEQGEENLLSGQNAGVLRIGRAENTRPPGRQELDALEPARRRLLAARDRRPQPARDETQIVALNGLTIEALVVAGKRLGEPSYLESARRAAVRLWELAYDPRQRLLHHEVFHGRAQLPGFPADYALLGLGYLALAREGGEPVWSERARLLAEDLLRRFRKPDGSLGSTPAEGELVVALADQGDIDMPSGTSAALDLLLRLEAAPSAPKSFGEAAQLAQHLAPELDRRGELWAGALAAVSAHRDLLAAAPPADALSSAAQVRAHATLRRSGDRDLLQVELRVAPGYHVNANPASFDYLIPTALELEGATPEAIRYPPPVKFKPAFAPDGLDVYEGTVKIEARLPRNAARAAGPPRAKLTVQACDQQVCLPPATIPVAVETGAGR